MPDLSEEQIEIGQRAMGEGRATAALRMALAAMMAGAALVALGCGADAQDSFNGYPCTEDCSGHQAGYDWAQENGIQDPDDCGGNSQSFIEGCQSYTEENGEPDDQDGSDEDMNDDSDGDDDSE